MVVVEIRIEGQRRSQSVECDCVDASTLKGTIAQQFGLDPQGFYLTQNGRLLSSDQPISNLPVRLIPKLLGGKGGFGSMLRAIGAQIEKTTNRDACRDLSGRRLRDINEEQRLKRWFSKQEEREKEREEQRQKKLEKLRKIQEGPALPLIEDQDYNKQREEMADSVFDAVDKGFIAAKAKKERDSSNSGGSSPSTSSEDKSSEADLEVIPEAKASDASQAKGPNTSEAKISNVSEAKATTSKPKKKLKKTMLDDDLSSGSSSDDSDVEDPSKK